LIKALTITVVRAQQLTIAGMDIEGTAPDLSK